MTRLRSTRGPLLAAASFLLAALAASVALGVPSGLGDAEGPADGRPRLAVQVANTGSLPVEAHLLVHDAQGRAVIDETFDVEARQSVTKSLSRLAEGRYDVRVAFDGRANASDAFRTSDCDADETIRLSFEVHKASRQLTVKGAGRACD